MSSLQYATATDNGNILAKVLTRIITQTPVKPVEVRKVHNSLTRVALLIIEHLKYLTEKGAKHPDRYKRLEVDGARGVCPAMEAIARAIEYSERHVERGVKELEDKGLLRVRRERYLDDRGRWRNRTNWYFLHVDLLKFKKTVMELLGLDEESRQRKKELRAAKKQAITEPTFMSGKLDKEKNKTSEEKNSFSFFSKILGKLQKRKPEPTPQPPANRDRHPELIPHLAKMVEKAKAVGDHRRAADYLRQLNDLLGREAAAGVA